jgi:F-type H+-transporting ATPase subunit delta
MADYQAGKRYAQAAFAIAKDGGTVNQWRADLADIATVLVHSDAAALLANGRTPLEQRLALLDRMLDIQPLALNLAKLLVARNRSADAEAVAEAFNRMADEDAGIEHASVTTAVPIAPDELARIEQQLGTSLGKRVEAVSTVDPSLIGGVVVRVGDRLIVGSVRTRLKQLRRELAGAR